MPETYRTLVSQLYWAFWIVLCAFVVQCWILIKLIAARQELQELKGVLSGRSGAGVFTKHMQILSAAVKYTDAASDEARTHALEEMQQTINDLRAARAEGGD